MSRPPDTDPAPNLDEFVLAFEEAHGRDAHADLADFLPAPGHSLRRDVLRELVRVDLEYAWAHGRPRPLDDYLSRFPELAADRRALGEIAFEEYRLRHQAGQCPDPDEYRRRFGVDTAGWPTFAADDLDSWGDSSLREPGLGPMLRELPRSDPETACLLAQSMPALPEGGSRFLGFELIAELGRGAFGRVYLARQGDLANRLVALKIAVDLAGESQTLAQLQHTNIVPIYSVHHAGPFQAVCMPYFRSTTLAAVLDDIQRGPALPTSGRELVQMLREQARQVPAATTGPAADTSPDVGDSALRALERLSYVEAVLWLGARLADGLAHAHDRGIIHRDLKPGNVLWTEDGQPMLVDFNLSADTKRQAARVGGTLPYMAPEHLDALGGGSAAVDARSDLYALGVILHELLTGRRPFPVRRGHLPEVLPLLIADRHQTVVSPRALNRAISPAVASILRRLLHPDPAHRYQSARELQEDLQRQLAARPLRHAPDPSPRERLAKWARRHPRLASPAGVGAFLAAVAVGLTALFFWNQYRREHAHRTLVQQDKRSAEQSRDQALIALAAEKRKAADTLGQFQHAVAAVRDLEGQTGAVQALFDVGLLSAEQPAALRRCRTALARYHVLRDPDWQQAPDVRHLPPADRDRLRRDVGELLYLLARSALLQVAGARGGLLADDARAFALPLPSVAFVPLDAVRAVGRRQTAEARRLHELASACYPADGAPLALLLQRAVLAGLDGRADEARRLTARADAVRPATPRDAYLAAYEYAARDEYLRARALADQALAADRKQVGTWFLLGLCHAGRADYARAVACYDVCLALEPDWIAAAFNRGLAHLARRQWAAATADFDAVLARHPDFALALGYRARARGELGQTEEALADYRRALELEPTWLRALLEQAALLSGTLGRSRDALPLLDRAVTAHPGSLDARMRRAILLARLGQRRRSHEDAEACLARDAGPAMKYQAACVYALTSRRAPQDRRRALLLLTEAVNKGHGHADLETDSRLVPLHGDPAFRRLVRAARTPSPKPSKE